MANEPGDFLLFTSLRYDPQLRDVPSMNLNYAGWNSSCSSALYMLDLHRDRLLRAARHWGWDAAIEALTAPSAMEKLASVAALSIGKEQLQPLRVRITMNKEGQLGCETFSTTLIPLENLFPRALPPPAHSQHASLDPGMPGKHPMFEVAIDYHSTTRTAYTHFKTTRRQAYDEARRRAGINIGQAKEVLLIDGEAGLVMEGSITTPYFWRNGRWVTPPVSRSYGIGRDSGGQDGTTRLWALERAIAFEEEVPASGLIDGEDCWISNGVSGFLAGRLAVSS